MDSLNTSSNPIGTERPNQEDIEKRLAEAMQDTHKANRKIDRLNKELIELRRARDPIKGFSECDERRIEALEKQIDKECERAELKLRELQLQANVSRQDNAIDLVVHATKELNELKASLPWRLG